MKKLHYKLIYISLIAAALLFGGCSITSYYPDPIYEDHPHTTEVYYYGVDVYFGYHSGFYYYYGKPHYYPWYYYYSTCPPYNYNTTTHIVIKKPVIKPTHRPIITRPNKPNITIKPNRNNVKPNRNKTNNKVIIKRKRK